MPRFVQELPRTSSVQYINGQYFNSYGFGSATAQDVVFVRRRRARSGRVRILMLCPPPQPLPETQIAAVARRKQAKIQGIHLFKIKKRQTVFSLPYPNTSYYLR